MFEIFTKFADWSIAQMGLSRADKLGEAVHFFIEDTTNIFVLIYVLIFAISLFRTHLSPEKARDCLSKKSRWAGYFFAVFLGAVTPFCSCSSIPLFIGFIAAGVPFGVSVAFLVSSPLISEIAAIMLLGMGSFGVYIACIYIISGTIISVLAGYMADKFRLERLLAIKVESAPVPECKCGSVREKMETLIRYANSYACETIKSLAPYILLGLGVGGSNARLHTAGIFCQISWQRQHLGSPCCSRRGNTDVRIASRNNSARASSARKRCADRNVACGIYEHCNNFTS